MNDEAQFPTCSLCGDAISYVGEWWIHDSDITMEKTYNHCPPDPYNKTESFDLREMLTGDVNRLRYITRYSTSLVLHRENVAEHSYYVSLYAMFITRWVDQNVSFVHPVDQLTILQRCLVHDLDEARTGDFQRPFKYRRPGLKNMMDEAAKQEFSEAITSIFPGDRDYVLDLSARWEHAKDNSWLGSVVAFADYLSVISHLYAEVSCANMSVMHHYRSLCEYSHKFDGKEFEFIRPLIVQTREIFKEMMHLAKIEVDVDTYKGEI